MKKMKAMKGSLLMGVLVCSALASCSSDGMTVEGGTGALKLSLDTQSGFTTGTTRAVSESDYTNVSNYTVQITDKEGVVKESFKGNAIPGSIELPIGNYTVTASYGEEKAASRDNFLSTGSTPVNIISDDEQTVKVTCAPTCGKAAVKFDPAMADYYTDYYVEYSTPALGAQKATWAKTDVEPWYLKVTENGDNVTATIHLTPKEEYLTDEQKTLGYSEGLITQTYTLCRNKAWTMNIKPNYTTSIGQLGITITIDESTNDKVVPVIVPSEWIVK